MNLLTTAIEAAVKAGAAILEVYATSFNVELKQDDSPITKADRAANTIINRFLEKTPFPIISEENDEISYSVRRQWKSCWMVDPLDGTKEFVKRNGEFTVNIAFLTQGKPVLGVIFIPVSGMLYMGDVAQQKAWKMVVKAGMTAEELWKNASGIRPKTLKNKSVTILSSRSHLNEETQQYISDIKKEKEATVLQKGSSLKFCVLAEGGADIYPRFSPTMEWDTAAGHAICKAVGLQVIDAKTRLPLQYNKENLTNPSFVAGRIK